MDKLEQIIEEIGCEVYLFMTNKTKEKIEKEFPEFYLKYKDDICEISDYYTSFTTNDDTVTVIAKDEDFK